jgi:hypothetical protein
MACICFLAVEMPSRQGRQRVAVGAHNEGVGTMRFLKIGVLACLATAAACSSSSSGTTTPPPDAAVEDTGITEDTGTAADTGVADTGTAADAGTPADTGASPDTGAAEASTASTFTQVYTDIISPICVTCHNPQGSGGTMGKLDMSSQSTAISNLVGVAAMGTGCGGMGTRVVAGSASTSILFEKVDPGQPAPCGAKMPLDGTPLTTAQADEIQSWINAGALNN